ncbi:MAG: amino acid transporter [Cyanobacteria bacterium REEB67]|nr:amino acid transporter [Cyanobacteria bacterium REEB67]
MLTLTETSIREWFLDGAVDKPATEQEQKSHQHPWWQVMCVTGVDYFSSLGYAPGIAIVAAGVVAPQATLLLVLLTIFGALPIYRCVAQSSFRGLGSVAMLEKLMKSWWSKGMVLVLLGFAATDFQVTITLSDADGAAHLVQNPLLHAYLPGQLITTLILITLLSLVFLKGFKEVVGIAVFLVGVYLTLNAVVVAEGFYQLYLHQEAFSHWHHLLTSQYPSWLQVAKAAALASPALALGLSGFETGVAVEPTVRGCASDTDENPVGRIKNTRKLLLAAAVIMACFLMTTSVITSLLIPAEAFKSGGEADGRALAYMAHLYLGAGFGTVYDLSTAAILWFAGASGMAGLISLVPRYLPRFGMAPDWAKATRPLVIFFTAVSFGVTFMFHANVDAESGAYATGVLVLITSACMAVLVSRPTLFGKAYFALITLLFAYFTVANVYDRPDGLKIASFFIGAIVLISLVSRIIRSFEVRVGKVELDETALEIIHTSAHNGKLRIFAHKPVDGCKSKAYNEKAREMRVIHNINEPAIFFEVELGDSSDFKDEVVYVKGSVVGNHRVLRCQCIAVPNAIAAMALYLRDVEHDESHMYFSWSERSPLMNALRYLFLGQGETAAVAREVIRQAEKDSSRRPFIHVA